jgi:hypothetical protein
MNTSKIKLLLAEQHKNTRYDAIDLVNKTMLEFSNDHDRYGLITFSDIEAKMTYLSKDIMNLKQRIPIIK